ncbi:2-methoxy-6-polyprenyl-1,4-benzoquinol methylase, mitochondrial-like isoform X2 [Primulina huaijiensis]
MNEVMSGGMYRLWKEKLVSKLNPFPEIPFWIFLNVLAIHGKHLDVAGGTGFGEDKSLIWVEGDAEALQFEDNSMDGYTIAIGIRNVTHIKKALAEAFRVLKRGGKFLCLELNHVDLPIFKRVV